MAEVFGKYMPIFIIAVTLVGCSGDDGQDVEVAAVRLDSGVFGALTVDSNGERLMTMVSRDDQGNALAVTGALWTNAQGESLMVLLDPVTNLPDRLVVGKFVLVFSNWRWHGAWGQADIARVHVPTGFIDIHRDVVVGDSTGSQGQISSALTCFPACSTDAQNMWELVKIAGLGVSIGACGVAVGISWGAAALPCAGVVVTSAKMMIGDEEWLGLVDKAGALLTGIDMLRCVATDASACIDIAKGQATGLVDEYFKTMEEADSLVGEAFSKLNDPLRPEGVVQGQPLECIDAYQCEPGHFLPCYPEGVSQCLPDCTWSPCPDAEEDEQPVGPCSVSVNATKDCRETAETVTANCKSQGGHVSGWITSVSDCVAAYNCWSSKCPCMLSCIIECGSDQSCLSLCMIEAAVDYQEDAIACESCPIPQVEAKCQFGG